MVGQRIPSESRSELVQNDSSDSVSLSGNRTPVTRVTGGYTDHYTNKDALNVLDFVLNMNKGKKKTK